MKRLKEFWKLISDKFSDLAIPAGAAAMVALAGCSSAKLKKCESKAVDPALQHCSEQVQGQYYKCEKPEDLYLCQDPN